MCLFLLRLSRSPDSCNFKRVEPLHTVCYTASVLELLDALLQRCSAIELAHVTWALIYGHFVEVIHRDAREVLEKP